MPSEIVLIAALISFGVKWAKMSLQSKVVLFLRNIRIPRNLWYFFAGTKIDETLYAWVAVFLLPVNSALNPVLYTLTTRLFKQQLSRFLSNLRRCELTAAELPSAQSRSSQLYYRGSKKTLVTTLSDVRDSS